jgi:membrane carboxypeptidase/penicillin-binding protein
VAPAAGKTGTSRDGWFAGFTSELLCVVWIGFDDNRDLGLEGSRSALPVWTEFMKQAIHFPDYANAKQFPVPNGVVSVNICDDSGQLATPYCPSTHRDVFVRGTQPEMHCQMHTEVAPVVVSGEKSPANEGTADRQSAPIPAVSITPPVPAVPNAPDKPPY